MDKQAPSKLGGLITNAGLTIGSLLIMFVLFEVGFRIIETAEAKTYSKEVSWAVYDEELRYRPRPNFGDTNAYGLRDDPIDPVKTKYRILMLGDSVAYYGDSNEDTFVGKLETKLNENSRSEPFEVINAGIRGYTNYQELLFLKKYGLEFEPDLVGVAFVLNDLHPFLHEFRVENGEVVGEYVFVDEAIQSVDSPVYRLVRKSHFLVWLRGKMDVFESLIESYSQDDFAFKYRPDFNTAWDEESWVAIEGQLSEMVQMGENHGFRVFLVAFPFGQQYRDDYLEQDYAYVTVPQRRLKAICEALEIPYLDLYPLLDRDTHLDSDDIHLTKLGRALVAEEIAEFLVDENLISDPSVSSK